VPDDVGGLPFPDGDEPELQRGGADDEFASVVLDEDFVRAAEVHEPTAVERILAASQSHSESDPLRGSDEGCGYGPYDEGELGPDGEDDDPDDDEGRFDRSDYTVYLDHADLDHADLDRADSAEFGGYGEYADADDEGRDGEIYGPGHVPFGVRRPYGPSPYRGYGLRTDRRAAEHPGEFTVRPGYDLGEEHGSDFGFLYGAGAPAERPPRGHFRWQRPVAWVLAVVMGIGMVALAVSAVYRGGSSGQQRQEPAPAPASSGAASAAGVDRQTAAGADRHDG